MHLPVSAERAGKMWREGEGGANLRTAAKSSSPMAMFEALEVLERQLLMRQPCRRQHQCHRAGPRRVPCVLVDCVMTHYGYVEALVCFYPHPPKAYRLCVLYARGHVSSSSTNQVRSYWSSRR
jgi:hypothetical protein